MAPDDEGIPPQTEPPVRELNVFSIDKVPSDDDLFDFRPQILPSEAEEDEDVEVPKALSATEPASESSENETSTPVKTEEP